MYYAYQGVKAVTSRRLANFWLFLIFGKDPDGAHRAVTPRRHRPCVGLVRGANRMPQAPSHQVRICDFFVFSFGGARDWVDEPNFGWGAERKFPAA